MLVLLSGAEMDGLKGIRAIKDNGGKVIAQNPDSSMIPYSLEKIIATGAVELMAAPSQIADHILLDAR
jgi:two-component system CheB/CheR fusion protein